MTKLIFMAGSLRADSFNKKLARAAENIASSNPDVETTFIDLKDFSMPIYDGDIEEKSGLPENAKKLKKIFVEHDGFFIASPEYNSSFSAALKNSLDWISRPEAGEPSLAAFNGKVAAISAASPGGFGGLRGLVPLRMLLSNINVLVIPQQLAIPFVDKAFDASGNLTDEKHLKTLENVVGNFVSVARRVKG